jgi:CheY-like chemotaxis protein
MMVVLLSSDLMGMSRVEGAARQAGLDFRFLPSVDAVADFCASRHVALVLIDLSTPRLDMAALVHQLRSDAAGRVPRTIAFGPHVHEEALEAAAAAGCDRVLSRGAFMAQLGTILAENTAAI